MKKEFNIFVRKASLNCEQYREFVEKTYQDYKAFVENNKEIALADSKKHCLITNGKVFNLFFAFKGGIYLLDPLTKERESIYMLDIDFCDIKDHIAKTMLHRKKSTKNYISKLLSRRSLLIKEFSRYICSYCKVKNINYVLSQTDNGLHLYIIDNNNFKTKNTKFIRDISKKKNSEDRLSIFLNNSDLKFFYELYCDPSCACNLLPHYRKIDGKNQIASKQLYAVRASQKLFVPFENKGYSTKFNRTSYICNSIVEKIIATNIEKDNNLFEFYEFVVKNLFTEIEKIKKLNIDILTNEDLKKQYKEIIRTIKTNYNKSEFNKTEYVEFLKEFINRSRKSSL